jgi:hypothetical protein
MNEYFNGSEGFVVLLDIDGTDIGRLWSTHYPKRKTDAGSRMFCLSIAHSIRNIAQNYPCGGVAERLQSALKSLGVPEEEFWQFTEETKAQ